MPKWIEVTASLVTQTLPKIKLQSLFDKFIHMELIRIYFDDKICIKLVFPCKCFTCLEIIIKRFGFGVLFRLTPTWAEGNCDGNVSLFYSARY